MRDIHNIPVPRETKQSFRVGDSVRIAMTRRPFKKGYTGQWSEELFVVLEKLRTIPTTYRVKDLVNEQIDETFYHQELQLVRVEQDKVYKVERVLKKGKRGKKVEYIWKGYGDKFMDHKRRRHCMIFSFSKQTSWINFISDYQATALLTFTQKTEHLHMLQNY